MGSSGMPHRVGLFAVAISLLVLATTRISLVPQGHTAIPTLVSTPATFPKSVGEVAAAWHAQNTRPESGFLSGNSPQEQPIRRVFVVGCGHSGTSVLFRSVGNMRGVRCMKKETALFIKNTEGDDRLRNVLEDWDGLARRGNFSMWVEKTPRHVYHIGKMLELDPIKNNTRIIFVHRDGRDVAISFRNRGYSIEKAVDRWVEDNTAALPYLESGAALAVSFDELTSAAGVLRVLRHVADFLELHVLDVELPLALMPGTKSRQYQEYCTPYRNDDEKITDLAASLVGILAGKQPPKSVKPSDEDLDAGLSDVMVEHNEFRTWQMAQAWAEVPLPASRNWTVAEERYFYNRDDVKKLMARFGYPDERLRER